MFGVRSELEAGAFGLAGDLGLFHHLVRIFGDHKHTQGLGSEGVGGFVDVGANIGDVSSEILHVFGPQSRITHAHYLSAEAWPEGSGKPTLLDAEHGSPGSNEKIPFLLSLEASPTTADILERRFQAGVWEQGHAKLIRAAVSNSTGSATFCYLRPGSENSGLTGSKQEAEAQQQSKDGGGEEKQCVTVPASSLVDILNKEQGEKARIFFLKIVRACVCACVPRFMRHARRMRLPLMCV